MRGRTYFFSKMLSSAPEIREGRKTREHRSHRSTEQAMWSTLVLMKAPSPERRWLVRPKRHSSREPEAR